MKIKMLALVFALLGSHAHAGDGFLVTSHGLMAILNAKEVQTIASPFYIESIRQFGEILPDKMTYILRFQREDLGDEKFCLVVTVEGLNKLKITDMQKWQNNSRLCHD